MTRLDLAQMSQDEIIDLVLAQAQQVAKLVEQNAKLQAEIEALRMKLDKSKKPPTNSGNSSQPPSKDQKGNAPDKRKRHKHGPARGHTKYERPFVALPDHIIEIKPTTCKKCQAVLDQASAVLADVNQITELPQAKAEVIEVRQYSVNCSCCGSLQKDKPPVGLEMERAFGNRLEATVVYYRQEQHMSYIRTRSAMQNLHGVEISEGGIDKIMQRAGVRAIENVKVVEADIQQSAVIYCDETTSRVDSNTFWQWVFSSATAVFHVIRFNRSVDVIKDTMGDHKAKVWISDCYGAQMNAPSQEHQLCLAHQLRNLQAVVEQYPKDFWARHIQILFRYAIHLHNQRQKIPEPVFFSKVERIELLFDKVLNQTLDKPDTLRLQKRYRKYRASLFVFLYRPDVSPTNNVSERYLRPSVIHRKVTGCFRSRWGAKGYAALKSLIDTGALSGVSPFDVIQNLFGHPALPVRV
jgi:transposase